MKTYDLIPFHHLSYISHIDKIDVNRVLEIPLTLEIFHLKPYIPASLSMCRALEVRLYPIKKQCSSMEEHFGLHRFLWNKLVDEYEKVYQLLKHNKKALNSHKYKSVKEYCQEFSFLKQASAVVLQRVCQDYTQARKNWFDSMSGKRKGKKVGKPVFKHKKKCKDSFRVVGACNGAIKVDFNKNKILVPKCGWIEFRHNKIRDWFKESKLLSITVTKKPDGRYFASVLFEGADERPCKKVITEKSRHTGLDMSLPSFFVMPDGTKAPGYKKHFCQNNRKLARLQRNFFRKTRIEESAFNRYDSNNRKKAGLKAARFQAKISDMRLDFIRQTAKWLATEYDVISVETLELSGMIKIWGKHIAELSWGRFLTILEQKCSETGSHLIKCGKWFKSSKICNSCGSINDRLVLEDRSWTCISCCSFIDRDTNAAQNIDKEGFHIALQNQIPEWDIGQEMSELTSMETGPLLNSLITVTASLVDEVEKSSSDGRRSTVFSR